MKTFLLSFCLITILSISCTKEKRDIITIEGFLLRDNLGNQFGNIGNTSDDWQISNWSTLSTKEQSFLNFSENINLVNTVVTNLDNPSAYPNPVSIQSRLHFHSGDSVKLKIVLVNAKGEILNTSSLKIKGFKEISFDLSDANQFADGTSLRYYYSFSALAQQNFKAGYGDIRICRVPPVPTSNCF